MGAPLDAIERAVEGGTRSLLLALRRRALAQSLPIYLVGGPIRDALLGTPSQDLDFVVEGDAPSVARQLSEELGGQVVAHPRFGTATVTLGDCRVDLATARKETYSHPGALPDVSPGTVFDDLARRDFSINSLALPLAERQPRVLDPHGGINDLNVGLIRILHPGSFVDDPTRIWRAIRYEQRFSFLIEEGTLARLRESIAGGHLAALSGDRLRHELERILQEARPELALRRCAQLGLLPAIHPCFGNEEDLARLAARGTPGPAPEEHIEPTAYLAALAYRLSAEGGDAVVHRLNLPRSWATVLRDTIQLKAREADLAALSLSRSQLSRLVDGLSPAATTAVACITDSPLVGQRLRQYLGELRFVAPALNGGDVTAMGVPQGPLVGQVLRELRNAKLDQRLSTEADERGWVQEFLATLRG